MADLAKDAQIHASDTVLACASKLLVYLWETAWHEAPGVLEGDADALHDMRVAVRRARSALQNFEGEKDNSLVAPHVRREMKQWRRVLGELGDALGAVRDYDVLNDYLDDYAKEILQTEIADDSSLARLHHHFSQERKAAFEKMTKRLKKSTRAQALHEEFGRYSLGLPAASGPNPPLPEALEIILPQRKSEVLLHAPSLDDSQDEIGQHELRKALKRLRYTLEFFAPCFAKSPQKQIKQITQMQDTLGEMQDRTVLHQSVTGAFGNQEKQWPADIAAFAQFGSGRREELFIKAQTQWLTLHEKYFDSLQV